MRLERSETELPGLETHPLLACLHASLPPEWPIQRDRLPGPLTRAAKFLPPVSEAVQIGVRIRVIALPGIPQQSRRGGEQDKEIQRFPRAGRVKGVHAPNLGR